MSATVTLSDGTLVATFWEVTEEAPIVPKGLEVLADAFGAPVVYTRVDVLDEVGLSGRLKTGAEVDRVQTWLEGQTILILTSRDGRQTRGWRIRPNPAPSIKRKEGDSPDWLLTIQLWRVP
jgi:hypothetical protein